MGFWLWSAIACGWLGSPDPTEIDEDGDGASAAVDCDDADPERAPGLAEVCDGIDNDCDGRVDALDLDSPPEGLVTWYVDGDGDGFGNPAIPALGCSAPPGYVADATDCDDTTGARAPGLPEICDGVDNDCDNLIDDADLDSPPTDGVAWHADADGDGFGDPTTQEIACVAPDDTYVDDATDCDDTTAARAPGLDEVCDALDNDCDELVDDADLDSPPVDAPLWFPDADEDGFGDASLAVQSCVAPALHIADGTDCDDGTEAISPGIPDVPCDGVDNDCDGMIDDNVVPRDFATLQDAVDTLTTGTVCVEPGSYGGPVAIHDREITFVSREGAAVTTLDLSSEADPFIALTGASRVVVEGFTVTGLDNARGLVPVRGAFLDVVLVPGAVPGDAVTLLDVVFDAPRVTVPDELTGGMVHIENATARLGDVDVLDLEVALAGPASALRGAFLSLSSGRLVAERLTIVDPVLATTPSTQLCVYEGALMYVFSPSGRVELTDFDVHGGRFTVDCPQQANALGSVGLFRCGTLLGARVTLDDNEVRVSGAQALAYGLIYKDAGSLFLDDGRLQDNTLDATGSAIAASQGALTLSPTVFAQEIDGLVAHGNQTLAQGSPNSGAYGGALATTSTATLTLDRLDLRANTASAAFSLGGGVYTLTDELVVEDAVFAGNLAGGPGTSEALGGALHQSASGGTFENSMELDSIDFVGNRAEVGSLARGGAVDSLATSAGDLAPRVALTSFVGNEVSALTTSGAAMSATSLVSARRCNLFDNAGAADFTGFSPTPADGNLFVDPEYVDTSGDDPRAWDLRLTAGSPLVDAGGPGPLDPDGSPPDIGSGGDPTAP